MSEASEVLGSGAPESNVEQAWPPLVLSPDGVDSLYDREQIRVGLGLADRYVPLVIAERYHLLERIARGAMGSVYRAHDDRLGRELAIKVVSSHSAVFEHLQAQLIEEAKVLARVRHPNVLLVYDVGETDRHEPFITMDYVEGSTLRRWQRDRPFAEVLGAYLEAGRGLAAVHRVGVVHRDFKPDNVLVSEREGLRRVVVGDFGLASTSSEVVQFDGSGFGTPFYMPPEQHMGEADPRCDQYAFCVCLWEAVCGERPFAGVRTPEQEPRRPKALPRWLYRCLRRGLSWSPDQRYADLDSLLSELERGPSRVALVAATLFGLLLVSMVALSTSQQPVALQLSKTAEPWPSGSSDFGPVIPGLKASPRDAGSSTQTPAPLARSARTRERTTTRRPCERDTLYSRLSELRYRCQGTIELEIDARGRVDAPELARLHGLLAPGQPRNCRMKVKCPTNEY